MTSSRPGDVCWAELDPVRGREQGGRRPVVIVASADYLAVIETLVIIVPATSVHRGWPNHVLLAGPVGLDRPSWAMTEQPRTITRDRLHSHVGAVDPATLAAIGVYLRDFML